MAIIYQEQVSPRALLFRSSGQDMDVHSEDGEGKVIEHQLHSSSLFLGFLIFHSSRLDVACTLAFVFFTYSLHRQAQMRSSTRK